MNSSLTLMDAPFLLILLFMLCGDCAASQNEMTAELYWRSILPQTPIPATIHELISSEIKTESLESEKSPNFFIKYKSSEIKPESLESEKSPNIFVKYKSSEIKPESFESEKSPNIFVKYKSSEIKRKSLEGEKSLNIFIKYKSSEIKPESLESEKSPNIFVKYKSSELNPESLESEKSPNIFIKYKSSEIKPESLESEKSPNIFIKYKSTEIKPESLESEKSPNIFVKYKSSEKENPVSKEPNAALLFLEESLKPGTMMTGDLTKMHTIRPFLSADTARKTPFSLTKLPEILALFSIDISSPEAAIVHRTLSECEELQLLDDERRRCATSLESMVDFVEGELGDKDVHVLETALRGDGVMPPKQEYKVGPAGARLVRAEALVSCHPEPYPRAVYYCHRTTSTKAYKVQLMGADGAEVSAVATCHTDTTAWSPDYIGFKLFNVKPGTHICHFMPQGHIIFARLAKNKANAAH